MKKAMVAIILSVTLALCVVDNCQAEKVFLKAETFGAHLVSIYRTYESPNYVYWVEVKVLDKDSDGTTARLGTGMTIEKIESTGQFILLSYSSNDGSGLFFFPESSSNFMVSNDTIKRINFSNGQIKKWTGYPFTGSHIVVEVKRKYGLHLAGIDLGSGKLVYLRYFSGDKLRVFFGGEVYGHTTADLRLMVVGLNGIADIYKVETGYDRGFFFTGLTKKFSAKIKYPQATDIQFNYCTAWECHVWDKNIYLDIDYVLSDKESILLSK